MEVPATLLGVELVSNALPHLREPAVWILGKEPVLVVERCAQTARAHSAVY
jgi:hypothetical protein